MNTEIRHELAIMESLTLKHTRELDENTPQRNRTAASTVKLQATRRKYVIQEPMLPQANQLPQLLPHRWPCLNVNLSNLLVSQAPPISPSAPTTHCALPYASQDHRESIEAVYFLLETAEHSHSLPAQQTESVINSNYVG